MKFLSNAIDLLNYAYLVFSIDNCINSKVLPGQMHTLLPSLQVLSIRFCPELESFPDGVLPSSLNSLETYSCEKLIAGRLGWGLQALPFLRRFCMRSKFEISEYFPERELLPSSLTSLEIWIILFWNLWMVISFTFIGDWLLPNSSFHARRGSANISMFP